MKESVRRFVDDDAGKVVGIVAAAATDHHAAVAAKIGHPLQHLRVDRVLEILLLEVRKRLPLRKRDHRQFAAQPDPVLVAKGKGPAQLFVHLVEAGRVNGGGGRREVGEKQIILRLVRSSALEVGKPRGHRADEGSLFLQHGCLLFGGQLGPQPHAGLLEKRLIFFIVLAALFAATGRSGSGPCFRLGFRFRFDSGIARRRGRPIGIFFGPAGRLELLGIRRQQTLRRRMVDQERVAAQHRHRADHRRPQGGMPVGGRTEDLQLDDASGRLAGRNLFDDDLMQSPARLQLDVDALADQSVGDLGRGILGGLVRSHGADQGGIPTCRQRNNDQAQAKDRR